MIIKKEKINQSLNAIAEDFNLKKIVYMQDYLLCANYNFLINQTHKLFWHSNLNEPQRKNFVFVWGKYSTKFWIIWILKSNVYFIHSRD